MRVLQREEISSVTVKIGDELSHLAHPDGRDTGPVAVTSNGFP